MGEVTVLERVMYTDLEAARLLRLPSATFRRWLDGADRSGVHYGPVIRSESTGARDVTWGEFVEATYLKQYRKIHGVSLQRLRAFITHLRAELDVPYPLAHHRPYVGEGRRLLLDAQVAADLDQDLRPVEETTTGQLVLLRPAESFLDVVHFENDWAAAISPDGKNRSPVVIDPQRRFGAPSIKGVSTSALAELVSAGEPIAVVADDYGLSIGDVAAAVVFEEDLASAS